MLSMLLEPCRQGAIGAVRHNHIRHGHTIDHLFTVVEEWQYVGMIKLGDRFGIAFKEVHSILRRPLIYERGCVYADHLNRDLPVNARVLDEVHFSHTSTPKWLYNTIASILERLKRHGSTSFKSLVSFAKLT